MGLFHWLFGKSKPAGSKDQHPESSRPTTSGASQSHSRWYFFSLGYAMGAEVFRAIWKDDDFMSIGGGKGLADGKLRVRHYSNPKADASSFPKAEATFGGAELARNKPPQPIHTVSEAYRLLGGDQGNVAIVVVLADSRFDDFYSRFRDYLNNKYIEAGALPIGSGQK
jgi:hypothetical protein